MIIFSNVHWNERKLDEIELYKLINTIKNNSCKHFITECKSSAMKKGEQHGSLKFSFVLINSEQSCIQNPFPKIFQFWYEIHVQWPNEWKEFPIGQNLETPTELFQIIQFWAKGIDKRLWPTIFSYWVKISAM